MNQNFQAGAARVNITPPIGVPQAGYSGRERGSESIDDKLFGKALVLDDGKTEVAIVTTDLIGLSAEFVARLRTLAHEQTGIPPENLLACASHTHFGPVLKRVEYLSETALSGFKESYVDNLVRLLAGAVRLAYESRQPARIGWELGQAPELMYNRRTKRADGKIVMSWRMPSPEEAAKLSFGLIDSEVGVLKVEGENGQLIGALINFACHPVCGTDRMYAISADYPGYAMKTVEQIEGGVCLFALGCAGNIVPIEREGQSRKRIGTALGAESLKLLQRLKTTENALLSVASEKVELSLKPTPTTKESPYNLKLAKEIGDKTTITTEIQAIRIGELVLMGLPGEVFVEIGLAVKKNRSQRQKDGKREKGGSVFVISLSNDSLAYVPTESAYDEGGYESEWTKLERGSGEKVLQAALKLTEEIRQ